MEFEDTDIEPFPMDGFIVPVIRQTGGQDTPKVDITVGGQPYVYERSYPIKGHSAVLPGYLREQMAAGRRPLMIERPDRFYVYFAP